MISGNFKMAYSTIKNAKWRSFLTMLGVIIGVASVVIVVSIGEGAKQQLSDQIKKFGPDLITVRPGITTASNSLLSRASGQLTDADVGAVSSAQNVRISSPLAIVNGTIQSDGKTFTNGSIIATSSDLPELINHKVEYGGYFGKSEISRNAAVIGQDIAVELFNGQIPVGSTFKVRGEDFVIRGVFEKFPKNVLSSEGDWNRAVLIPYSSAKELSKNNMTVFEILAKPSSLSETNTAATSIKNVLLGLHGNQEDFSVLQQDEIQYISNETLNLITAFASGIAAISLFVGGIGIMNIMLVSVTERIHEIGIRKAIGATNRHILTQFMTEALLITIVGSIIGILFAFAGNYFLRVFTDLKPVINIPVALGAAGISIVAGVLFGVAPAYKAARKNPIEALRSA